MATRYRLAKVRVFVTDWERSLAFYRDTMGMEVSLPLSEPGWAELETGVAKLAVEAIDPRDPEATDLLGRFLGVSLEVEDVYERFETLRRLGVDFVEEPERQAWGGVLAHLRDPDGNIITLMSDPG